MKSIKILLVIAVVLVVVGASAGAAYAAYEVEFSPGDNLVAYQGNCGVVSTDSAIGGTVRVDHQNSPYSNTNKSICTFDIHDSEGNVVSEFPGLLTYYFNLNKSTYNQIKSGELLMYINIGGKWETCSPSFVVGADPENDVWGQVVCLNSRVGDTMLAPPQLKSSSPPVVIIPTEESPQDDPPEETPPSDDPSRDDPVDINPPDEDEPSEDLPPDQDLPL